MSGRESRAKQVVVRHILVRSCTFSFSLFYDGLFYVALTVFIVLICGFMFFCMCYI